MLKDKDEFLRQKKGIRNEADETAQQLINIYRQLSILGEEATERYNKQLLEQVNSDVLASLKTIPGGEEVRDYYAFLTDTDVSVPDSSTISSEELDKLLPKAEEISPLWAGYGVAQAVAVQPAVNAQSLDAQAVSSNVVTKTVQVPVGLDEDKVRQLLQEFESKQKMEFERVFQDVVIDSNIDIMHAQIQNMSSQVISAFENAVSGLAESLGQCNVDKMPVAAEKSDDTRKKTSFSFASKNAHRRLDHKFSVDMSEEE